MYMLDEAKYLLDCAEKSLEEIKEKYNEYTSLPEVPLELKENIREFLGKVNSSLEYQAFIVFSRCCEDSIPPQKLERARSRVYFPCRDTENAFRFYIKDRFPGLNENGKLFVDLFEEVQPYNVENKWLSLLSTLNNGNKHRALSKQYRNKKVKIVNGVIGGVTLKNVTLEGFGTPIMYGNTPIEFEGDNPFHKNFNYSTDITYVFSEINRPVLTTLENIYTGALRFTNKFEDLHY